MARSPRIEYPGAVYHVITRGNNRQVIFHDDADRTTYLDKLAYYCAQKEVQLLCYCPVSNYAHLLLRTPQGNLSTFMQPFQTSYTVSFNRRHRHTGHVFVPRPGSGFDNVGSLVADTASEVSCGTRNDPCDNLVRPLALASCSPKPVALQSWIFIPPSDTLGVRFPDGNPRSIQGRP